MLKKDKTKPFRLTPPAGPTDPEDPTNPTGPTVEDMLKNCAVSKLKADRTPIPDNRFTLPPEYGVAGGAPKIIDGHEYVDLGLPSGILWAKMNVGAESEKDVGLYFAWGETTGYPIKEVDGNWVIDASKQFIPDDYAFTDLSTQTITKYNTTDGKTVLDLEDDAAHVNMGGDWHMPNMAQCIELFKETKNGFVTNAGAFTQHAWDYSHSSPTQTTATISGWDTAGYFFFKNTYTSVTEAISAEDYLFIPAAGYCVDGGVYGVGDYGDVWASALNSEGVEDAWSFGFGSGKAGVNNNNRCFGQSVRGVVGQMDEITPGGGGK